MAIAFDNDEAGNLMAQRVKLQLPEAIRKTPKSVDWNEDLVNTFNWVKSSKNIQAGEESERMRSSEGGLSL